MPVKKKKKIMKTQWRGAEENQKEGRKEGQTSNFDGLQNRGSALVSCCPVESANREGTG